MNCTICMTPATEAEATTSCPSCRAPYHEECWTENGGCAVYGCAMVPKTENLTPLEIPPAFWGREDKDCPQCGKQILAMAVRCRHCGARVEANVEAKGVYERRQARKARAPRLKQLAVMFLIFSLLPLLSLVSTVFGTLYYRKNRDEIARLPGSYSGYYRIGIAVGTAQVAIFALAMMAWWIKFVILKR